MILIKLLRSSLQSYCVCYDFVMENAYAKYLKEVAQAITISFLCWSLGALVMWGYVSFKKGDLAPVPESVVTMVGISTTGSLLNRFIEGVNSKIKNEKTS